MLAQKNSHGNNGVTLIEILVSVIIIGVVAAITAPNVMNWFNNTRVNQGLIQLETAMRSGQRQAERTGEGCEIQIDIATRTITGADDCLTEPQTLDDNLIINTNDVDLLFSSKGTAFIGASAVYVIYMNGNDNQRCFVVAPGLGLMRSGDYDGDPAAVPPDENNCISN